jgi:hypothetical protein
MLSTRNAGLAPDLPIYLRFADGSQFDGVTLIEAFAHARHLYQGFLNFESLLADSAHDNYATYDLLRHLRVRPFIDLKNAKDGKPPKPQKIRLSKNGIPICADGHEMVNWGFDRNRFRTKFRAPCVVGKVSDCPYRVLCCKTPYGRIVYLRHADNLRFFPPVPRGSDEWKKIYSDRTAAERVNNRILTDCQLERPKLYRKKNLAFFAFINALNVHLDAQVIHHNISLYNMATRLTTLLHQSVMPHSLDGLLAIPSSTTTTFLFSPSICPKSFRGYSFMTMICSSFGLSVL